MPHSTSHYVADGYRDDHIKQGENIMRKLIYDTPELRIALTEADIKADDTLSSLDWSENWSGEGGAIGGVLIPEDSEEN